MTGRRPCGVSLDSGPIHGVPSGGETAERLRHMPDQRQTIGIVRADPTELVVFSGPQVNRCFLLGDLEAKGHRVKDEVAPFGVSILDVGYLRPDDCTQACFLEALADRCLSGCLTVLDRAARNVPLSAEVAVITSPKDEVGPVAHDESVSHEAVKIIVHGAIISRLEGPRETMPASARPRGRRHERTCTGRDGGT